MHGNYHALRNDELVNFIILVSRLSDFRSKIQEDHANILLISFWVMLFFFVYLISADDIIIIRFQAEVIFRFYYSIHIFMLKISCRLIRLLT